MAQWIRMPVDGDEEILIEVGTDGTGNQRVGRGTSVEQASETLRQSLHRLRPAAEAVLDEFRAMRQRPSKITVQFGIKVTGEANLIIAKTAGEANFTVSMEWTGGEQTQ